MIVIKWVLAAAAILAAGVVLVSSSGYLEASQEEGGDSEVSPTPSAIEGFENTIRLEEVTITPRATATATDVRNAILAQWEEGWSDRAKAQTIDISIQLHRAAEEQEIDPIIVANEYMDILRTTMDIQPVLKKGWDGGLVRAMLMSLDFYEGARRVRNTPCHELDRNFPEDMDEGQVPKINPYMLLSMAYRESRLAKRIELGEKLGRQGERGMFQFLPQKNGRRGFVEGKFMPRFVTEERKVRCSPFDRGCATRGAARALAWIRCKGIQAHGDQCTIAVFMAGYGMNRLPSPAEARHHRGPVNARRYLCKVREDCDELWPIDSSDDFALSL